MLDEIYLRLLLELLPANLKLTSWDMNRLLDRGQNGDEAGKIYANLINQLYTLDPGSNIGLRFGQHLRPSTLCDYSRTLLTAPRVREALHIIGNHQYLHSAVYFPSIHIDDQHISIALTYPFKEKVSATQRRFCAEGVFSYLINAFTETTDTEINATSVCFDYAPPSYAPDYQAQFKSKFTYRQPLSVLQFDRSILDTKLRTADSTMHPLYFDKCLDQWRRSAKHRDIKYRAMSQLMQHAPDAFTSQILAKQLNISVRGLQKRLSKHDESFSNLAARARRELAKVYLFQKRASLDTTAEALGFQTSSGFRRFFKAEFGMTPAEYIETSVH